MTTIDFTPLYRSTVGFDRLADLFDFATDLIKLKLPTLQY